ncbi:glycosyl transferase family 25 [Samsonia erythrinae]|uniref:Glycosyl transferase family 25 n=2 Tax=Samsonia erythrinae TaxID=160434 RepID=A0A4R3VB64_9GAMM|nr:glycosyl transferase family 25 [Samsonia erythrinae]
MIKQCSDLNIDFEFFPAIRGSALTEEDKKKHLAPISLLNTPGELGCALSHIFIYKKMIDENIKIALILEDDALLGQGIVDVVNFLGKEEELEPTVTLLSPISKYIDIKKKQINKIYNIYDGLTGTLAHGYVINNSAAHSLYKFLYPAWSIADHWFLFKEYGIINLRGVIPHCIDLSDHSIQSEIGDLRFSESIIKKNSGKKKEIKKSFPFKMKKNRFFNKIKMKLIQKKNIKSYSIF